jgi:tetratricopeptide (TPR) repeat protein
LDAAVAALPDAAPLRKARAETRLAAGDADGALSDLHVALDIHPEDLELRDMRARIEFQLGLYKEAAFDFVKLVELSRAAESAINPHWHAGAALSLAQDNQYEDAVEHLSQAMNLDPLNPAHVANRGWMQFSAGDFVSALTDLDAAIALDPDYERAHLNRQAVVEAMAKQPRS